MKAFVLFLMTIMGFSHEAFARYPAKPSHRLDRYPYHQVISSLTPELEKYHNVFIFVNTNDRSYGNEVVPHQHMMVVQRTKANAPVFVRDRSGMIQLNRVGNQVQGFVNSQLLYPYVATHLPFKELFPVSTGVGGAYIHTYSGIFGFNYDYNMPGSPEELKRGVYQTYSTERFVDGMAHSSFIEVQYSDGGLAGVAIHATPQHQYWKLGKQRASEGCIRQYMENAAQIQSLLSSPENVGEVPMLDITQQFPYIFRDHTNRPNMVVRQKALIILFEGY